MQALQKVPILHKQLRISKFQPGSRKSSPNLTQFFDIYRQLLKKILPKKCATGPKFFGVAHCLSGITKRNTRLTLGVRVGGLGSLGPFKMA